MSNAVTNGRPQRKQLSDQIAKLETLLDGLAEGLTTPSPTPARRGPGPLSGKPSPKY